MVHRFTTMAPDDEGNQNPFAQFAAALAASNFLVYQERLL
jgi:hypothetical protein